MTKKQGRAASRGGKIKVLIGAGMLLLSLVVVVFYRFWEAGVPVQGSIQGSPSKQILYWIDPMEPQIHYKGPGKSRMGMELIPVYAEGASGKEGDKNSIRISPALVQNLGVRTAVVEQGLLHPTIRSYGLIRPNEEKIVHVHSYVEGWVQKLHVKNTQDYVQKGQPLFEIYSRELRLAQKEFLLKKYEAISIEKLRSLGVSEKQIEKLGKTRKDDPLVVIFAPASGFIDTLNIREGMWIDPEMTLLSLTDLSEVWVLADVFPSQIVHVHPHQEVTVFLPHFPDKSWAGKIDFVYPTADPVSLTAKVRIRLQNPDAFFKPNMYVAVEIKIPPKKALKIPQEAVIWTESGQHVIVALGEGRFQPRPVVTGVEDKTHIEIVSGLHEGEKVVTSAQFLLDSEISLKSALQRLDSSSGSHGASHAGGHGS